LVLIATRSAAPGDSAATWLFLEVARGRLELLCELIAPISSTTSTISASPAPARRRRNTSSASLRRPAPPPIAEVLSCSSVAGSGSTVGVRFARERSSHVQSQRVMCVYFD